MSRIRSILKYTLLVLLVTGVIVAGLWQWLRWEFTRAQVPADTAAHWSAVPLVAAGPGATPPCREQHPANKAWFGALHVHTAASYDATAFGTTTTSDQAYAFARGEPLPLTLRGDGADYQPPVLRIGPPLDFMAVTDHAEALGENRICYTPEVEGYGSLACRLYRGDLRLPVEDKLQGLVRLASFAIFGNERASRVCGPDGSRCRAEAALAWRDNQRSTEQWLDRSGDCAFTTFHGYEYTLAEDAANLHRNVIFGSAVVPEAPLSARDAPTPEGLWAWLDEVCLSRGAGCDALAIPHNSNWSSGRMWFPYSRQALPTAEQQRRAALRARLEPLAEIMQVKGDSECRNGIASVFGAPDELCDFEKLRPVTEEIEDCGESTGSGGMMLKGCTSRYSFVRYALTAGLGEREKLGVNPFALGIIAASDTHIGAPDAGRKGDYPGAHGNDRDVQHRLLGQVDVPGDIASGSPVRYNPGGVAGVYAEENSRTALFAAMRRRETFGTSGPRIAPRFFAGWELPADLCDREDYPAAGYRHGVPMGADLPPRPVDAASPVFVASASRDPGAAGSPLQRIQVIKGWLDSEGRTRQAVYDVAGSPAGSASLNPDSCTVTGPGHGQLCASWQDPDFDPAVAAVYYARVVEVPSCRWSHLQCQALPAGERPSSCSDPDLPWQVQERAWTSPIWYYP